MSADSLKPKKDRRVTPNRRAKSRNGRRFGDADHTTTRFLCPHCGVESVEAIPNESGYKRYACRKCGRAW